MIIKFISEVRGKREWEGHLKRQWEAREKGECRSIDLYILITQGVKLEENFKPSRLLGWSRGSVV